MRLAILNIRSAGSQKPEKIFQAVGVPKSLLLILELKQTFYANFLVTNSITLPEKDISIFLFIQIFLIAFRESILI